MHHAEAKERLADLALEPARLAGLELDLSPDAAALHAHLAACPACAADLEAWRRTWRQVRAAFPEEAGGIAAALDGDAGPITAPGSLRARTLAAVAADAGMGRGGERTSTAAAHVAPGARSAPKASAVRGRRWLPWLAAAAALVIAVGAGTLAWSRSAELDQARSETAALAASTATLDRVLAAPVHWVTTLRASDGSAAGTVAWTPTELAVVTTALPGPSAGEVYRCWVERDGVRTPVGAMSFSGSTGHWAGPMDGWADAFAPGATFGVSLVSADGSTPVLVGQL